MSADLTLVNLNMLLIRYGEEADRERGLAMGADAYISKPINGHELMGQVEELLGKAG